MTKIRKLSLADVTFQRSPGQDGNIFVGDLVDARDGGPVTIGYGRWDPGETLKDTIAVDDVMILLEGRLTVTAGNRTVTAGPGEIVYMPKGETVTIQAHEARAITAYVTYPHWNVTSSR